VHENRSFARRRRASLLLAAVAGGATLLAAAPAGDRRSVTFMGRTMGTYSHVVIVTADSAAAAPAVRAAHATFARVDSLMSNWTTTSEVARINRAPARTPILVEPEVAFVLAAALTVFREGGGTYDITVEPLVRAWGFLGGTPHVPTPAEEKAAYARVGARHLDYDEKTRTLTMLRDSVRIDLGGIAKGYGVDAAAETLAAHGVRDALVDLSGNMRALGHPAATPEWRIGVRDPRGRRPYFARLNLHAGEGVATSAKYEQFVAADGKTYGHILDPRTGRPADGLIAVTVFAPTAMDADAWDTALFVLGPDAARQVARSRPEISVILIEPGKDGVDRVWVESSLRDRFELVPEAAADFKVEYFD
jgi:thiamine biosynthesis lipoprotein